MSAPGNTAPSLVYQEVLADPLRCVQKGCREQALDGKDRCGPHYAAARAADRKYKRRKRKEWKRKKRCTRCGGKRLPGHGWGCAACVAELGALSKVFGERHVYNRRPTATGFDSRAEGDGYERRRYRGQGKRGRQPTEQLDDQDLRDAGKHFERAVEALKAHNSDKGKALPVVQRRELRDTADAEFNRVVGLIEDIWRRHRYSRPTVEEDEA